MNSPTATQELSYADLLGRWGVTCESQPGCLRITIPPTPGWTHLSRRFHIAFALLVAWMAVVVAIMLPAVRAGGSGEVIAFAVNLGFYGLGLAGMLAHAWERLHHRIVIEVNNRTVTMTVLSRRRELRHTEWARSEVGEAKYNVSNGKLLIRIIGCDLLEVFVGPNRQVTEWVAQTLNEALQAPYTSPPSATPRRSSIPPPMKRGPMRTAMFLFAALLATTGIAVFFTPIAPLGIYLLMSAVAPIGIALGTQEKKYYL